MEVPALFTAALIVGSMARGPIVAPAAVSKVTLPVGEVITTLVIAPLLFKVSVKEDAAVSTTVGVPMLVTGPVVGTPVQVTSWLMPGTTTVEPAVTADQLVKGVPVGVVGVVEVVGTVPPLPPPPPHADKNVDTIAAARTFC